MGRIQNTIAIPIYRVLPYPVIHSTIVTDHKKRGDKYMKDLEYRAGKKGSRQDQANLRKEYSNIHVDYTECPAQVNQQHKPYNIIVEPHDHLRFTFIDQQHS